MQQAKKMSIRTKPNFIKKKELKLNQEDIKRTPKLTDGGYIWAG